MSSQRKNLSAEEVVAFLEKIGGLPSSDIADLDLRLFDCIEEEESILAIGGIEVFAPYALLRSVAVLPEQRGRGLARKIVGQLESLAKKKDVAEIFLLTTDAAGYFENLGYRVRDRSHVPSEISSTSQFSDLCPSSSILMSKSL